jgi:hypothetical protein
LPIEFARTSSKSADKRVTLVTLSEAPPVRTLWCLLAVNDLNEAKQALVEREGITGEKKLDKIGFWEPKVDPEQQSAAGGDPLAKEKPADKAKPKPKQDVADAVGRWAAANDLAGVVWTDLEPTFGDKFEQKVIEAVLKHLRSLSYTDGKYAEEYVRRTPRQIDTECRRAIEKAFGWAPVG